MATAGSATVQLWTMSPKSMMPTISGFGIWDSGFAIRNSGFGIWDSGFAIRNSGSGIWDSGFAIRNAGFGIWDSGFAIRNSGFGMWDSGFAIRNSGSGIRDSRFRTRDSRPAHSNRWRRDERRSGETPTGAPRWPAARMRSGAGRADARRDRG